MSERTSLADLEPRDVEEVEPDLKTVGYQLRPRKMRPNDWEFETLEAGRLLVGGALSVKTTESPRTT
jgi:hypothetical protein